ncbi:MAG: HdeD family acid-resistance protein [Anaerolineae bacterium]|jgi:uncharacterized membrane protein HdeD (DUF308 family)|nr:HdeD family acid-resistance protein [Anaerolineae bacterium]
MNELTLAADAMRSVVRKTWWIPLIQGVASIIIGVLLLSNPATTLVAIAIFLGAFWFVGGIFDVIGAFTRRDADKGWLWALLAGIISIIAGLFLLGQPVLGAIILPVTLAILVGVSAVVSGIFNIIWAIRARNEIQGEGWLILWGVISIILGIYVLANPGASAAALVLVIAILAAVGGIAMVIFAFRLRSAARS